MITCDDVKGELYYFLTKAANTLLSISGLVEKGETNTQLSKIEQLYSSSENAIVKQFVETVIREKDIIFGIIDDKLSPYQLEQSMALIESYVTLLEALPSASDETKEEFFLTLTYNIIKDLRGYTEEYNEMVRRKKKSVILRTDKVDVESTFFLI
jgi:hypothetical protein